MGVISQKYFFLFLLHFLKSNISYSLSVIYMQCIRIFTYTVLCFLLQIHNSFVFTVKFLYHPVRLRYFYLPIPMTQESYPTDIALQFHLYRLPIPMVQIYKITLAEGALTMTGLSIHVWVIFTDTLYITLEFLLIYFTQL